MRQIKPNIFSPGGRSLRARYSQLGKKKKSLVTLSLAGLLVLTTVGLFLLLKNTVIEDKIAHCAPIAEKGRQALKDKNYTGGYEELRVSYEDCGSLRSVFEKQKATSDQKIGSQQYSVVLAKLAYLTDDKISAEKYAQEAMDKNKYLTDEEREKIPNQAKEFFYMLDILDGLYKENLDKSEALQE